MENSKRFILALLFLLPALANSQSIGLAPMPLNLSGEAYPYHIFFLEYKSVGVIYFHNYHKKSYWNKKEPIGETKSTLALSFAPVNIHQILRLGALYSARGLPTQKTSKLNFSVDLGVNIKSIRISYLHISNGFKIFGKVNPGLDYIRITFKLNKFK